MFRAPFACALHLKGRKQRRVCDCHNQHLARDPITCTAGTHDFWKSLFGQSSLEIYGKHKTRGKPCFESPQRIPGERTASGTRDDRVGLLFSSAGKVLKESSEILGE